MASYKIVYPTCLLRKEKASFLETRFVNDQGHDLLVFMDV